MSLTNQTSSITEPEQRTAWFPTATQWFGLLIGYFLLQIILRVTISSSCDLDEADQLVLTQKLSWGYGSQPPLYTWLQIAFFKVFGLSIFSMALLKNVLLFSTYVLVYLTTRSITGNHASGMAASASLLFIPQIAWESQRDLTHSVIASTFASATWLCFFRLRQKPTLPGYAVFGLCVGLGLLSKYNYALLLGGIVAAALSMPEFRRVVLDHRVLWSVLLMVIVVLPNALWVWDNGELAFRSAKKFGIEQERQWLPSVALGMARLLLSTTTFLGPLALIYGVIFLPGRKASVWMARSEWTRLLWRTLAAIFSMILVAVLVFEVPNIRDRWLQPILVWSPVLMIAVLEPQLDRVRLRRLLALAGLVMVVVAIVIPGRIVFSEKLPRIQPLNRPYDELARQMRGAIAPASAIITDGRLLGGNLRLKIPDKMFLSPELGRTFLTNGGRWMVAWDASPPLPTAKDPNPLRKDPPPQLQMFATSVGVGELKAADAQYFTARFKFHRTRQMVVGLIALPATAALGTNDPLANSP